MNRKCKRYRDVWVAPGSQMFEALETGYIKQLGVAEQIYRQCERDAAARMTRFPTYCEVCTYRLPEPDIDDLIDGVLACVECCQIHTKLLTAQK